MPMLFYSRRIGLDQGRSFPSRPADGSLAASAVQHRTPQHPTGDVDIAGSLHEFQSGARQARHPATECQSACSTRRSPDQRWHRSRRDIGVDGTFAFFSNLTINTYWAKTRRRARGE